MTAQSSTYSQLNFELNGGFNTQLSAVPTSNNATNDVKDGVWHHIGLVRQGNQGFVYRDGYLSATDTGVNIAIAPTVGQLIAGHNVCGVEGDGTQYRGQLDEIKLFGVALTAAEIAADMSPPSLSIAPLPGAVRLTWTTNSPGYLLETNSSLLLPNVWGVLTSNYSIIETNYAVTNAIGGATRFYRLHKP